MLFEKKNQVTFETDILLRTPIKWGHGGAVG